MLSITKIVTIVLLVAITSVGFGQASETPYKLKYENSPDLPNGIAFYMTLIYLDHSNTRFGAVDAAASVAHELGLSNVDSHNLLYQALTTLYFINTDVKEQLTSHACHFAGPSVAKTDKYAALQQTYEIHTAIYDHYYDQTKASLDPNIGERLQQWMDERKLNIGHFEIDFEKADERIGKDSTVTRSRLCEEAK